MNRLIARFYNNLGKKYYDNWKKLKNGMMLIGQFEVNFVKNNIDIFNTNKVQKLKVLDVGSGPGRIAEIILKNKNLYYYGIDISSEMIEELNRNFSRKNNFTNTRVGDISIDLPYKPNSFEIVTCIRVLKYNKNWPKIIKNIGIILKSGGLFLFTIPNKHSLNFFSKGSLPIYKTTIKEIVNILNKTGFKNIKIEISSKLPDILYFKTKNQFLLKIYVFTEKLLSLFFKEKFSRLLYISCYKK